MCNSVNQSVQVQDNERRKRRQIVKLPSGAPAHPKAMMYLKSIYEYWDVVLVLKNLARNSLKSIFYFLPQQDEKRISVFTENNLKQILRI